MDYSVNIEAAGTTSKDRAEVVVLRRHAIVIVADGAGGVGSGAITAERCVSMMRDLALAARQPGPADVCAWLARVDDAILAEGKGGLATAVALFLSGTGVVGASVGNSQAWIVADEVTVLTERQHRKPMMGSGGARPVGFSHGLCEGWLVVGTDGLFNYASRPKISRACEGTGARLADGGLQDDIAVAALRPSPIPQPVRLLADALGGKAGP